jgi:hypothetical protein
LERFRRDLVGDHLRSIYQQLSADPNSLSNLEYVPFFKIQYSLTITIFSSLHIFIVISQQKNYLLSQPRSTQLCPAYGSNLFVTTRMALVRILVFR